jgi:hypothetical protein
MAIAPLYATQDALPSMGGDLPSSLTQERATDGVERADWTLAEWREAHLRYCWRAQNF